MHQIRPFISKVRSQHSLKVFPTKTERIAFVHGCLRDMTAETNVMVAFTMEYLGQCRIQPTRQTIVDYLTKISTERKINDAVDQLVRKHVLSEDSVTHKLTLHI